MVSVRSQTWGVLTPLTSLPLYITGTKSHDASQEDAQLDGVHCRPQESSKWGVDVVQQSMVLRRNGGWGKRGR